MTHKRFCGSCGSEIAVSYRFDPAPDAPYPCTLIEQANHKKDCAVISKMFNLLRDSGGTWADGPG